MPKAPSGRPYAPGNNVGASTRFVKGVSGNPGGKIKHRREKLANYFYYDLLRDWKQHGAQAIAATRETDPAKYVTVVASVVPKEILVSGEVTHYTELSDAELDARITEAVTAGLAQALADTAARDESAGAGDAGGAAETLQ